MKNIGLNEYEGHSAFDVVYGNKTDIEINMLTGDGHSGNKVNHVVLKAIEVRYTPSIKNIRKAADSLYSVESFEDEESILQPKGLLNIDHIRSEKRGILRVILSLLMQENTQTTIVRKLNNHAGRANAFKMLAE